MPREIVKPIRLRPGDTIGIVTPASPMQLVKLERGIEYLKSLGYKVELGEHVYDSYGYLAGNDNHRVNDLHYMFANPEIKAIISSRGGYGTPRLLDMVDYDLIAGYPKIFVGYSDLTALQLAIWRHTRMVTFSGPMAAVEMGTGIDPFTEHHLWSLLCRDRVDGFFPQVKKTPLQIIRPGKARGILLGGCLSLISSVIGTIHQPDFRRSILILEDVGEQPYRIDRYLCQLRSAGILHQVNGIILSQFVDCTEKKDEPTLSLEEIFADFFSTLDVPVVANFLYGHLPKKFTIPLGVEIEVDTSIPKITLLEPAVRKEEPVH